MQNSPFAPLREILQSVFESLPLAILITDPDLTVRWVNAHFLAFAGCSAKEIVGKPATLLESAVANRTLHDILGEVIRSGQPWKGEYVYRRKTGELRDTEQAVIPIKTPNDGITDVVVAAMDVTEWRRERKQAEDRLQEYESVVDGLEEMIVVVDREYRYVIANRPFLRYRGLEKGQVIGRPVADVLNPGVFEKDVKQKLDECFTGKVVTYELKYAYPKLGERDLLISYFPILGPDGIDRVACVLQDISERKHAEAARARLEQQLRQAQKLESVGRLAGGVAHDFNNLLTVINGYSALLLQTYPAKDAKREYIEEIGKAGERAAGLTKQLLAFSRKQPFAPKAIDLNAIINDTERMLARLIEENIRLIVSLQPDLGRVMADPDQIHQVLINMAINARDAMPAGGNLVIETANIDIDSDALTTFPEAVPGRYVRMSVTDTGVGMDEATLQRVFEPFFTTKEAGKGTGLGLSTVYGIVKQSGGWVEVWSEPGQGASFNVYLPRVDDHLAPDTISESETASHGRETVLVVEDQEEVRGFIKTVLKTYGYVVLEAANGSDACAVAREYSGSIHLLLTDVVMPGINGIELSERLRVSRPELKVLFTSGYIHDVIAHRGVLEREISYLPKPFIPSDLAAKVRDMLSAGS